MKYWSAGDIDSSIYDSFFSARKITEEKINSLLSDKSYINDDVDNLDVIYIIVKEGATEKLSYKPKSKELDLRIVVDYNEFLNALPNTQIQLLVYNLLNALEKVVKIKNIKNFDFVKFRNDLKRIFINV
jgi:hypothetical protein